MQTSVQQDLSSGFPGQIADTGGLDVISRLAACQKVYQVAVDGDNSDGVYSITIDGTQETTFTASSNSATEIRDGLLAAWGAPIANVRYEASGTINIVVYALDNVDYVLTVASPSADLTASVLVEEDVGIPFGHGVCGDPQELVSGRQCRLPRLTTDITGGIFLGITICNTMREANAGNGYSHTEAVSVARKGRIKVRVEDAVVEGGAVYCRFTDPSAGYGLGSFRSDADTSDASAVPGATYRNDAAAGGIAIVELNPTT